MLLIVLHLLGGRSACEVRPRWFWFLFCFFFFKQGQDVIARTPKSSSICQNKTKFVSELTLAYVGASDRKKLIEKRVAFFVVVSVVKLSGIVLLVFCN